MAFRSKGGGPHAIVETAISVTTAKPFGGDQLEKFVKAHETFKEELPRLQRKAAFTFVIGTGDASQAPPPSSGGGVIFDRVNPDGTLHSRINVDPNMITVNILEYTRWNAVWEKARDYLTRAGRILLDEKNSIVSVTLQYVDVFEWQGDVADYEIYQLLDPQNGTVPSALPKGSVNWHSHQGWFTHPVWSPEDRILERIHFDSLAEDDGVARVKVDTYLRHDLRTPISAEAMVTGPKPQMDLVFEKLHARCNALFRSAITDQVAKDIGLNA